MGLNWDRRAWMTLGAVSGFIAVSMGAFAAHGIDDPQAKDWIRTAASYQFMHALATFACATFMQFGAKRARFAPAFFLLGTLFFSGSLYAMALGAPRLMGAVTPIGGVLFLIGWAVLVWAAASVDRPPAS
jgi:uncharacterized membrane protein YgdD (TMEM256/DUF423 family)